MKNIHRFILAFVVCALAFASCTTTTKEKTLTEDEIFAIAQKAYIFGYPLVLMDLTEKAATNVEVPNNDLIVAPINQIAHARQFPDDKFTLVVKPNVDTYYSLGWFDLAKEPIVMSVPATDRYYLFPLLDAYTNVFASPGTRTTGKEAHTFLLAGPNWKGEVPDGMELIQSPTAMVSLCGRIQVNSAEDGATTVKEIQDQVATVPLSQYGNIDYVASKGKVVEAYKSIVPVENVTAMSVDNFFNTMMDLMVANPPAEADAEFVEQMKSIGIEAGKKIDMSKFSEDLKVKLNQIPAQVFESFKNMAGNSKKSSINGWSSTYQNKEIADFGTNYNLRAFIAFVGLGANLQKDAVYPNTSKDIDGNVLESDNKYVIHYAKDQIPPVNAFWSITMYNDKNFLAKNPINRFAIGDRNDLKFNDDGSLDIYIQRENPEKDKEPNWLPAPEKGTFQVTMRLYWPKEDVFNGTWKPQPIKKID